MVILNSCPVYFELFLSDFLLLGVYMSRPQWLLCVFNHYRNEMLEVYSLKMKLRKKMQTPHRQAR